MIEEELGEGTFAKVIKVNDKAVKVFNNLFDDSSWISEIVNTSRIYHPNIIEYESYEIDGDKFKITMPLGSSNKSKLDPEEICYEIASAVDFMMRNKIWHCDIKPRNLVYIKDHPVIIDFGLTRHLQTEGGYCMSFPLSPPEWERNPTNSKFFHTNTLNLQAGHLWALGILFYNIIYGENIYINFDDTRDKKEQYDKYIKRIDKNYKYIKLLSYDPNDRPQLSTLFPGRQLIGGGIISYNKEPLRFDENYKLKVLQWARNEDILDKSIFFFSTFIYLVCIRGASSLSYMLAEIILGLSNYTLMIGDIPNRKKALDIYDLLKENNGLLYNESILSTRRIFDTNFTEELYQGKDQTVREFYKDKDIIFDEYHYNIVTDTLSVMIGNEKFFLS